jgi:hypothetical protein
VNPIPYGEVHLGGFQSLFWFKITGIVHVSFAYLFLDTPFGQGWFGRARAPRASLPFLPRGRRCVATIRLLLQGQNRRRPNQDAVLGVKRIRFHQVELDDHLLPVLEEDGTFLGGLFDALDVARAPRLDRGSLPVGAVNFVKVHDADDLLGFILNFLVAVSYKPGDDHAAASQEFFDCDVLFHIFAFGLLRDRDATSFAVAGGND